MSDPLIFSLDREIHAADLRPLFQQAVWTRDRTDDDIHKLLLASPVRIGAWQGTRLVGFARVLTDDIYRALIEDVIVAEDLRGQGIGRHMIDRLLQRLVHVQEIILSCESHLVPFYQERGFKIAPFPYMNIWKG